jgi:nicotinate-nucleotide pyrophosphorylase (carboxylating)
LSARPRRIGILAARGLGPSGPLRFPFPRLKTTSLIHEALEEDGADDDITSIATIVSERRARGRIVARQRGVIAGIPLAREAFRQRDERASVRATVKDGQTVDAGAEVMFITASPRGLLSAERVALNYLQRLSGIATLTHQFVDTVIGTGARILDTRKTTPGWRKLEKFAVRAGGGMNHRMDLGAAVLIKDNHLAALDGDVRVAVQRARDLADGKPIEVECAKIDQVRAAIDAGAEIIMLDNMSVARLGEAVALIDGRAVSEASGGVTLHSVRAIAETGVDWISVGALTHSSRALDLALEFE